MNANGSTGNSTGDAPDPNRNRLNRERRTIRAMVGIYCRAHHGTSDALCDECVELHDYAMARLDKCPFGYEKTTCAQCPIHCYKPEMRRRIRSVMRYAGPRMITRHPILAALHTYDAYRSGKEQPPDTRKGKTQ